MTTKRKDGKITISMPTLPGDENQRISTLIVTKQNVLTASIRRVLVMIASTLDGGYRKTGKGNEC